MNRAVREGRGIPSPSSGVRRYFYLLWSFFWKIFTAGILMIVFSLPVLTIPAAVSAANRIYIRLFSEGYVFVWEDFRREFLLNLRRAPAYSLIFGLLMFTAYYLLSLGITNGDSIFGILFASAGCFTACFTGIWGATAFVMTSVFDLPVGTILKNSLAIIVLNPLSSLGILAVEFFFIFFGISLFPVSLPVCLLFLPGILQYSICILAYSSIKKLLFVSGIPY